MAFQRIPQFEVQHQSCAQALLVAGMRPELLNERLVSLSNDTVAVVDLAEKSKGCVLVLQHVVRYLLLHPAYPDV